MEEYIYFSLNDRKLKLNKINNDIYIWYDKARGILKNPYWKKINKHNNGKYLYISFGASHRHYLHRVIYYAYNQDWTIYDNTKNNCIDHIDGDPLNNNIDNLRIFTTSQNNCNRKEAKGYTYVKSGNKYCAKIQINKKCINLGSFTTEKEAREVYLNARKIHHGF